MRNKKTQRSRRRTVWKVIANFLKVQLVISVFLLGLAWGTSPVDKAELQEVVFSGDNIYRGGLRARHLHFEDEAGFYVLTPKMAQMDVKLQHTIEKMIEEDTLTLLVYSTDPNAQRKHVADVRSDTEVYYDYDVYAAEQWTAVKIVLGIWAFLTVCNFAGHGFAVWTIVGKGRRTSKLAS